MGLLVEGSPLPSEDLKDVSKYIRLHGIIQFLNNWKRMKDRQNDELKFGDEIECGIFVVDNDNKTVKLSIRGAEIKGYLIEREQYYSHETEGCTWHPEFGAWMVESTPSRPYTGYASDLMRIERNMVVRRRRLLASLREDEIAPTVTCYPLMGVGDFIHNPLPFDAPHSQSVYVPDYIINPHPRFAALTRNIRNRRGKKVDIRVPLFKDTHTPEFQVSDRVAPNTTISPFGHKAEEGQEIHMDAMAFGMGMCCLQVTFQARDVCESRYMYDQLAVLAPIMMALTAATPIFKGRLSDIDARWTVISQSVDDRTPAERGEITGSEALDSVTDDRMAGRGIRRIMKSRYDSITTYIYHCAGEPNCERTFAKYNDISCPVEQEYKELLGAEGIDENLAHHVAHLFIRDPIVGFAGQIELNDETSTDHFESIQSTNWQSCRWKPPPVLPPILAGNTAEHASTSSSTNTIGSQAPLRTPLKSTVSTTTTVETNNTAVSVDDLVLDMPSTTAQTPSSTATPLSTTGTPSTAATTSAASDDNSIGWRTEFRSMEVQLTDFENAGFTVFVVLVTRVILAFDLGLYIPLSKVDENMRRAHLPDAVRSQKFFFRKHIAPLEEVNFEHIAQGNTTAAKPVTNPCYGCGGAYDEDACEEMTMTEIFLGRHSYFPGLLPLVYAYLEFINVDNRTYPRLFDYLQFIEKRVTGELLTPATYIRRFVTSHPDYQHDSIVTPSIAHDLLLRCHQIGDGSFTCPELLGEFHIEQIRKEDAYGQVLAGRLSSQDRSELLKTLIQRAKNPRTPNIAFGKSRTMTS